MAKGMKSGGRRTTGKDMPAADTAIGESLAALEAAAYAEAEKAIADAQRSGATELKIGNPHLRRLPPKIALLTSLTGLSLADTAVVDLAPLANLASLQELQLSQTGVTDLAPIAGLTSLQTIELDHTGVTDLAPLAGLTALETLWLADTAVADLTPLSGHSALQLLQLAGSRVDDLTPIAGISNIYALSIDGTAVTDLAPIADLSKLQVLFLSNTTVSDLSPLAGLTDLETLWFAKTRVADLTPLAGLTALQDISLADTTITDLAPIAGLQSLCDAVTSMERNRKNWGLAFANSAVAKQRPFDYLAGIRNPARTVETINYLRRQQSLEEYWPKGYERPVEIVEFWKGFEAKKQENESDENDEAGDTDARELEQRPAPDVFTVVDGKIVGRPYRGEGGGPRGPDQPEMAAELHTALLEKLNEIREPSQSGQLQMPDRLKRTLERLADALGNVVGDVREGWLVSASRALSADISAYDTEAGRRELVEGFLAAFIDLNVTVEDLKACYPSIARLEAARIAQNLEVPQVEAAMKGMREIRDAAEKATEIVSDSAKESLARDADTIADFDRDANNPGISEERQTTAVEGRNRLVAYSLLTYRNFAAQVKKLAATATPSDETRKAVGDAARRAGTATADFGKKTADEINHYGPGQTGAVAVAGALGLLANAIAGPVAGLGVFLPTFRELSKRSAQKADDREKKGAAQKPAKTTEPKSNPKPKTPKT